jgi:hypothetical protein
VNKIITRRDKTMSITEMKRDLVNDIKGIDIEISALKRRFYAKLPDIKPEEVLHEEVVDYIHENTDKLQQILNKVPELKDIDVNQIKVYCWFWSKLCNRYVTIDMDDYYGGMYQGYRYNLIVGGDDHGDLIVNGYHEDNANDIDIVYKLGSLDRKNFDTFHAYINGIQNMVYEYFNYSEPIEKENKTKIANFNNYIRNHRIKMVTDVYTKLAKNYSYILDYSDGGRELYMVLMRHSDVLLTDINRELNGMDVNRQYFAFCRELKSLILKVKTDMHEWYVNVDKYVENIATNNIGVPDMSHNILSFV